MSIDKAIGDLIAALDRNTAALNGSQPPADVQPTAAKRGPGRPAKAPDVASQPVAPPAVAVPAPAPAPLAPAATAATVSFKEVADALSELVNAGGRDAGVALLAKYGAPRASALKPDQFAAFLGEVKALNKPAPAGAAPASLI